MRRTIRGMRAIVTGASSGIGRELALELARRGARLLVTARREDRLDELVAATRAYGVPAVKVAGDITEPRLRDQLCETAQSDFGGLDILVNNAGIGALGRFSEAGVDRLRQIMEVNFFAPVELIRQALPMLSRGQRPIVVNVASVLGHRAVPNKSEYCASKFALHGFSDALRAELASHKIDVLLVSPSATVTEFSEHLVENRGNNPSAAPPMSAASVARKAVNAIERGRHEVILSWNGKLLVWLDRIFPSLTDFVMARLAD